MKKRHLIIGSFALTMSIGLLSCSDTHHEKTNNIETKDDYLAKKAAKHNKEGYFKSMEPTPYMEYLTGIRTRDGQKYPEYAAGYKQTELEAALVNSRSARTEEFDFVERGPGNIAGRTRAVLVDVRDESNNTWFIGTAGGGIWKTDDAGRTWEDKSGVLQNLAVTSIAQCKSNPEIMYLATGESPFSFGSNLINGGGMWKSTDGGDSWSRLPNTLANEAEYLNFTRVVVSPDDPNLVVASSVVSSYPSIDGGERSLRISSSILRSTNGGQSWEVVQEAPSLVLQVEADPNDFNNLYAAVYRFGVYKSSDAGQSWTETNMSAIAGAESGDGIGRTEIAIARNNSSILYTSVDYLSGISRLLVSSDKGDNWSIVEENQSQEATDYLGGQGWYDNCIAVDPTNDNTVFWGGVDLWRTTVSEGVTRLGDKQFLGGEEEGTSEWLRFTSVDGFEFWDGRLDIPDVSIAVSVEIRFGGNNSQKAHRFLARGGNAGAGVAASEYTYQDYVDVPFEVWDLENNRQLMVSFRDQRADGEFTFTERNDQTDPDLLDTREYIFIHDITYDEANPNSEVTVVGGHEVRSMYFIWPFLAPGQVASTGTVKFVFGQPTYQNSNINRVSDAYGPSGNDQRDLHPDHHMLKFAGDRRLISVNDGGLAYSDDGGGIWLEVDNLSSNNLNTSQFYKVDRHPSENRYVGGMQDNGTWISPLNPKFGTDYNEALGGDGMECVWHAEDGNLVLISFQYNNIFRSGNGGNSFSRSDNGIQDQGADGGAPFVTRFGYSSVAPDVVYALGTSGIYRSTNFGNSWTLRRITNPRWNFSSAATIHPSLAASNIIWAGSGMSTDRSIFLSTNNGSTFSPVPSPVNIGVTSGIATDPEDANVAYLLFSQAGVGKIWRTNDLGQTWNDITGFNGGTSSNNGFPDVAVMDMIVWGDTLIAGTEIGLMASYNDGDNWEYVSEFPPVSVHSLVVKESDGQLVIGTHGRGIWTADLGITYNRTDQVTGILSPTDAIKVSVYPNPTQNEIRFELPKITESYDIRLYSITGQEVISSSSNGGGRVTMQLSNLNNGTYLLKASSKDKVYTQKVILNR